jgi:hypothetical protein
MSEEVAVITPQIESVVAPLAEAAVALRTQAEGLEIVDDETDLVAAEVAVQAASIRKSLSAERLRQTDPYEQTKKLIIATFRPAQETVEEAERIAKRKRGVYFMAKQAAAQAEQERLRKLADRRQERAEARAEAKGEDAPPPAIPLPTVEAPPRTVQTASGASTIKLVWKYEVTNENELPREWLMPNEKAIAAAVRAGIRSIPGVRVYQAPEGASR